MKVELRERSFGELLGLCFSLVMAHFGKLVVIVGLFSLPSLLLKLLFRREMPESMADPESTFALVLVLYALAMLLQPLQQGTTTLLVASSFTGDGASLGECFRVALRRFWPLLVLGVVVNLLIGFGALLLVVPGLMFLTWYFVSTPALLVENQSWTAAMARSKLLSAGHRWSILGFAFIVLLLSGMIAGLTEALLEAALSPGLGLILLLHAIQIVVTTLVVVAPVVYYFQLRVVKEALGVEELASLVDAIAARAGLTEGEAPA
jgi:hypothetical protein